MSKYTEQEIAKFDAIASDFWNIDGDFKILHQINPIRLEFIEEFINLKDKQVADIGCGGGILSEALYERGANTIAIDLSSKGIEAAKLHQKKTNSSVDYRIQSTRELLNDIKSTGYLDAVFCMEMLEHVENPTEIIRECSNMVKPGGLLFFSTINRTRKAHILAIIFAEYIARMVPQGTHDYKLFIKPSEMQRMANDVGLESLDIVGFEYKPFLDEFVITRNTDINYIFAFKKMELNKYE